MTTPVCELCPGAGGGYAVGQCSTCGRPACEEHFVSAAQEIPYGLWSGPRAEWRHGSAAYQRGWAEGRAKCTACRETAGTAAENDYTQRRLVLEGAFQNSRSLAGASEAVRALLAEYDHQMVPGIDACERWFGVLAASQTPSIEVVEISISGGGSVTKRSRRAVYAARAATYEQTGTNRDGDPWYSWIDFFVEPGGAIWRTTSIPWLPKRWGSSNPFFCAVTGSSIEVTKTLNSGKYWWNLAGVTGVMPVTPEQSARARILARTIADTVRP